jgi:ABC-type multidrug transport system permease subunit
MLVLIGINKIEDATGADWMGFLKGLLILFGIFYTVKAMRNFYVQGWGKTIIKFLLFNLLALISLFLLFTIFGAISILTV